MAKLNESGFPIPDASGMSWTEEGESGYAWAVFKVSDVKDIIEENKAKNGEGEDLAYDLTGWYAFSRGAGYAFANAAYVARMGRHRVLVKQYRGLDI